MIKMVVVPLVFFSLVVGIASLGDVRKLGRLGCTGRAEDPEGIDHSVNRSEQSKHGSGLSDQSNVVDPDHVLTAFVDGEIRYRVFHPIPAEIFRLGRINIRQLSLIHISEPTRPY